MATLRHSLQLFSFFVLLVQFSVQQQNPKVHPFDLEALFSIKNSLTEVSPTQAFFSTWNFTGPDPCSTFSGVTCALDTSLKPPALRVSILTLGTGLSDSIGLAGSVPDSISKLAKLTQLILSPGIVTGSIPPQLGKLSELRVISLANNRLTGVIPVTIASLRNLHTLDLSHNQLTGSIPPGLTQLPELKILILSSNSITGRVPGMSSQLLHLDLKKNKLFGPLPPSLPSSLCYLSLSENGLTGPLNGLESLSELAFLDLSMNQFSGPIPAPLFSSPTLSSLLLQRNNLSGGVPQVDPRKRPLISSPSYGQGSIVDLSHNFLTGELSTVLAEVESLFLNNNRLIGTVPKEYVKGVYNGNTRTLYLQHNYFTGFPMDEGEKLPDTASLCLSYNCMAMPVELMTCPASAGAPISRPTAQCAMFNYGNSRG
ncbi:hypothetical protein L6164_031662 [Bauhinia variegata]|uniref:Uncharacterized protein n=1 Tax=Bauhinia variegata TaxID=167791 RepID=A0ACB9LFN7_BAUVA|nr:hypothetical protein L6164_031662 [Bauhinia variegata]